MLKRSICLLFFVALLGFSIFPAFSVAQIAAPEHAQALLLSDIHLDPFLDPGKIPQLAAAPASRWRAILDAPPSADRAARQNTLLIACHTRGTDTSEELFNATLKSLHSEATSAQFAVIAGDLLAHAFDCKFHTAMPTATDADYRAFTVKTMAYILLRLRETLPGVPMYPVLGNNDSGCGDYQIDPHSPFLKESASDFIADLPASQRTAAQADFAAFGDYTVTLPAPFHHFRLLAIDDLFESKKYSGCSDTPHPEAAKEQLAWLTAQLKAAREAGDRLWVFGHIPPGVDPYSTATHLRDICAGQKPEMFLSSGALPKAISDYSEVVSLAIFAHTHMDEMRLIAGNGNLPPVAAKLTPSISPINGNLPAYTLATLDPAQGTLLDYRVIASSDRDGSHWTEKYRFSQTYHQDAYNAATASRLIAGFEADKSGSKPLSQSYIQNYYFRSNSLLMALFWPTYSCSLGHMDAESYKSCLCTAKP